MPEPTKYISNDLRTKASEVEVDRLNAAFNTTGDLSGALKTRVEAIRTNLITLATTVLAQCNPSTERSQVIDAITQTWEKAKLAAAANR